eukprot:scaffold931_cov200-Alexandrium_tamarense.AAC.3
MGGEFLLHRLDIDSWKFSPSIPMVCAQKQSWMRHQQQRNSLIWRWLPRRGTAAGSRFWGSIARASSSGCLWLSRVSHSSPYVCCSAM